MKPPRTIRAHAAFSLLECLAYIALLALVLTLAFGAFYRVADHSRHLARNAGDIVRALQAGERWRQEIRSAQGPIRLMRTNSEEVLLIPTTNGAVAGYVWRAGAVWRQTNSASPWRPFLSEVKYSRMELDRRQHVAAWCWEVELQGSRKKMRVQPRFSFEAVAPHGNTP